MWSKADELRYEAHKLAGRLRTAARKVKNIGRACHLCDGGGELFEMEGWAAPDWQPCYRCKGTGRRITEPPEEQRVVNLGVIEFHSDRVNPGLVKRFYEVVNDLRESGSIVDLWLMDIATVLSEFGYQMRVSTDKPLPRPICGDVRTIDARGNADADAE
jgi:hypothetical protein